MRSQSRLQILLGALIFLAVVASIIMVFTDSVPLLRIGLVAALWAAVIGAIAMTKYRKDSENDAAKTRDLKLVYELQLEREIAARREYELVVETQVRRQVEEQVRSESSEELIGLRQEMAALRSSLEALFDGELPDERIAVRAESHRLQELAGAPGRLIAAQAADLPPIEDVAVAQDDDAEDFEPDYEGYRQAAHNVIPGIADVDDAPLTAETQILSADDIVAQGFAARGDETDGHDDQGYDAEYDEYDEYEAEEFEAGEYATDDLDADAVDAGDLDADAVDTGEVDDTESEAGMHEADPAPADLAEDDAADLDDDAAEIDDDEDYQSEHSARAGGSSVADLMARLEASGTLPQDVGRRRRRAKD